MSLQAFLYVGLGGFLGANARYILSLLITERAARASGLALPFGTIFVNVTGSFLLALFTAWITQRSGIPDGVRLLIGTGFFGAYTTFSTYANESINLFSSNNSLFGWGYIIGTNLLCLFGVLLGLWLATKLWPA